LTGDCDFGNAAKIPNQGLPTEINQEIIGNPKMRISFFNNKAMDHPRREGCDVDLLDRSGNAKFLQRFAIIERTPFNSNQLRSRGESHNRKPSTPRKTSTSERFDGCRNID
jgi:hypothetical protein